MTPVEKLPTANVKMRENRIGMVAFTGRRDLDTVLSRRSAARMPFFFLPFLPFLDETTSKENVDFAMDVPHCMVCLAT